MAKASGGKVEWYATGTIQIEVAMPNGEFACKWCEWCRDECRGLRYRCSLTKEVLYAPDRDIGVRCPLEFKYPEGHEPVMEGGD